MGLLIYPMNIRTEGNMLNQLDCIVYEQLIDNSIECILDLRFSQLHIWIQLFDLQNEAW